MLGFALAWIALGLALTLAGEALLARWLAPRQPGPLPRASLRHLRVQLATGLVHAAGEWLSGTLFWPWWLRLAGMRVGRGCEISTILDTVPRHVTIGAGTFFADGIYLAGPRVHSGGVELPATSLGADTFLGNHVVVPVGETLPGGVLLGVSTVADGARMRAGTGWFGNPPFELPRREVVTMDRRLTHEPGLLRYLNRLAWEAARLALPAVPLVAGVWWWAEIAAAGDASSGALAFGVVPWATLQAGAGVCMLVLAMKWLLLGRVRPGQHALWSCWCSRWDFLYVAWNRFARPILARLEGTLLLPWYLRAMGATIGRRALLGGGFAQLVDPDMIHIGDGATVDAQFQAHSFEDRVLKIDHLHVGRGATVGHGVVLLYGAEVGAGATVAPNAVVMKHERLPAGQRYEGFPVRAVGPAPVPADLPAPVDAGGREPAFDAARGLAVLGMMVEHFVPDEGESFAAALSRLTYGKSAPLFCVLLGLGMALAARRGAMPAGHWIRRGLALLLAGQVFALCFWTTEILMPLGLMTLLCAPLLARGKWSVAAVMSALVVATPWVGAACADHVEADWLEDGTHLRDHGFGWHVLRYFTVDGNYPLVPWLAFALLGVWIVRAGWAERAGAGPRFAVAVAIAAAAQAYAWSVAGREDLDAAWASTWVPTSIPFVVLGASSACAVIFGLQLASRPGGLAAPLALLGRTSLSHYVLHIVIAYGALRLWHGGEDWSVASGVLGLAAYLLIAWPLTVIWLRRWRRGPFEAVLARAGSARAR